MPIERKRITKLSEFEIDVDKAWRAKGITNIKQVAALMTKGDMLFFDGTNIVKLSPGSTGTMLTTQGVGNNPVWSY